jgi:glycosyltransferase involved in cell wall biosynthesis
MTKDKPKIAMLVSDTNPGGTATSTDLLVRNIDRRKYKVIVVVCGPGPVGEQIGRNADEFHNLGIGSWPQVQKLKKGRLRVDPLAWVALIIWILRCSWRVFLWLRKEQIDLIHTNTAHFNLIAGIAGRLARVPSIWHIRVPQVMPLRRGGPFLVEGYLAALLATKFIANSYYTASTFHHTWKRKTVIAWNAIDVTAISSNQRKGQLRKMVNVLENEKLVGVAGLISPRKGMDRFIEMAAKMAKIRDNVKFVIVGGAHGEIDIQCRDELVKLAEELGISGKLYFTGDVDKASYYVGDMDAFFMCSRPGTETFGLVVIEAMAAEVPVVAFANDAMPEIIENGETGFLVPEGDTTAAAKRISQILDDSKLAGKFKKAGKERVLKNFDIPILMSNIEKLYAEVLR